MDLKSVLTEVQAWPPEDRLRLIEEVWDGLSDEDFERAATESEWIQLERTSQTAENATSAITPADLIVQPGEILTLSNFEVN